jgi:hypothetical protein
MSAVFDLNIESPDEKIKRAAISGHLAQLPPMDHCIYSPYNILCEPFYLFLFSLRQSATTVRPETTDYFPNHSKAALSQIVASHSCAVFPLPMNADIPRKSWLKALSSGGGSPDSRRSEIPSRVKVGRVSCLLLDQLPSPIHDFMPS